MEEKLFPALLHAIPQQGGSHFRVSEWMKCLSSICSNEIKVPVMKCPVVKLRINHPACFQKLLNVRCAGAISGTSENKSDD